MIIVMEAPSGDIVGLKLGTELLDPPEGPMSVVSSKGLRILVPNVTSEVSGFQFTVAIKLW
ncbi:hypothetical protein D3C76_1348220 [compost metagenome]